MSSGSRPSVTSDTVAATAYWSEQIRPELGDLPVQGLRYLRDLYVRDVQANPTALAEVREWWRTYGIGPFSNARSAEVSDA